MLSQQSAGLARILIPDRKKPLDLVVLLSRLEDGCYIPYCVNLWLALRVSSLQISIYSEIEIKEGEATYMIRLREIFKSSLETKKFYAHTILLTCTVLRQLKCTKVRRYKSSCRLFTIQCQKHLVTETYIVVEPAS